MLKRWKAGRSSSSVAMASWRWWPGMASWKAVDAVSKRLRSPASWVLTK